MYNYITSVGLLIDFFEDNGIDRETSSMVDALREYAIKNDLGLDEDLYEDYYSYYDDKNFDSESFNNDIKRTLEKIYDRLIEDVENETLDKNRELIDYIKKLGYSFDKIYNFPLRKNFGTETGKTFRLDKIEDGKIIAVIHGHRFKMDIEEFNNFLFHPELF